MFNQSDNPVEHEHFPRIFFIGREVDVWNLDIISCAIYIIIWGTSFCTCTSDWKAVVGCLKGSFNCKMIWSNQQTLNVLSIIENLIFYRNVKWDLILNARGKILHWQPKWHNFIRVFIIILWQKYEKVQKHSLLSVYIWNLMQKVSLETYTVYIFGNLWRHLRWRSGEEEHLVLKHLVPWWLSTKMLDWRVCICITLAYVWGTDATTWETVLLQVTF